MCEDITALTAVEAIRLRPGMYVGPTTDGYALHEMLWSVVGHSIRHFAAGRLGAIAVTIRADQSITVEDDGDGIPIDELDDRLIDLHAGTSPAADEPVHQLGFVGMELAPVNALSSHFEVETVHRGRLHRKVFERGVEVSPLTDLGPTSRRGTRLHFFPDISILGDAALDSLKVRTRLEQFTALFPPLQITLTDERPTRLQSPERLRSLFDQISRRKFVSPFEPIHARGSVDDLRVDVLLQWAQHRHAARIVSFAGVDETTEGGAHVDGLLRAFDELTFGMPETKRASCLERLQTHAIAVVAVFTPRPLFDGAVKWRLLNPEVSRFVEAVVRRSLAEFKVMRSREYEALID
jgi:DNA gyrase subunit B